MKKLSILFCTLFCLLACKEGDRVIEHPVFQARNSGTLEVNKIILTDTATIFQIEAFFIPNNWIRIDSLTYLQNGDKKYIVTGADGIELNREFYMPESGQTAFTLYFPPIDRKLKTIDLIESDCDGCFKTYGIDLTGKATFPKRPEGIPDEVLHTRPDLSGSIPDADMNIGVARINLHLVGYRKGMDNGKATLYNICFFPAAEEELEAVIDEKTGIATFELEQYGTSRSFIHASGQGIPVMISPGIMDIYVDLQEAGRQSWRYRQGEATNPTCYFTGNNAAINQALNNKNKAYKLQLENEAAFHTIAGMNADEFTNYVVQQYKNIADSIRQSTTLSNLEKELLDNDNKMFLHYFILSGDNQLERAYRYKNKVPWEQRELKDFQVPRFESKHYDVLKEFRIDDGKYPYAEHFSYMYPAYFSGKTDLETITGQKDGGFLYDLQKVFRLGHKVNEMTPLTSEEQATLDAIQNPFYANVLKALDKKLQQQMEEAKSKTGYTICEVPKVANEKLFDAIAEKYKGKVVFVDFWATWCGPCRSSMREMEPLKETELTYNNLVFVYITGETSPETKWLTMIPDVKGDHYRLSENQWRYVCDQFEINGIPSYVLIEKNGNYKLREDLRNKETMKTVLKEACAQ